MIEFYIRKMIEAHTAREWVERGNYAKAAGVDLVKWFYLECDDVQEI